MKPESVLTLARKKEILEKMNEFKEYLGCINKVLELDSNLFYFLKP